MIRYIALRLVGAAVVVVCVFCLSFLLMRFSPGSPFDEDREQPPEVIANQARVTGMARPVTAPVGGVVIRLSLDRNREVAAGEVYGAIDRDGTEVPLRADEAFRVFRTIRRVGDQVDAGAPIAYAHTSVWRQLGTTLLSYARFDFGTTFASKGQDRVIDHITETLPVSMELGVYALVLAVLLGVGGGLVAGLYQNTWADHAIMAVAMLGISVPAIVLGPILIYVFIVQLGWLPAEGGWESGLFTGWEQKVLPVVSLGLIYAAYFARLARGGMLEVVRQDWMRTARAKGLRDRTIVLRHALKPAILPAVTFVGPATASLLMGSLVVEVVFNIPGISKYFIQSAINRDYPMVMGVVVLASIFLVLLNLVVDVAYGLLDPRVRHD